MSPSLRASICAHDRTLVRAQATWGKDRSNDHRPRFYAKGSCGRCVRPERASSHNGNWDDWTAPPGHGPERLTTPRTGHRTSGAPVRLNSRATAERFTALRAGVWA